jgi:hypothetical protein
LHAFVAHLGQPELDGLGLGAGNGLHQAQQGFGGGDVGEALFAIGCRHLQLVTICHQFAALFAEPPLELVPVFARSEVIGLLCQHLHHVHHREPPDVGSFVVHAANGLTVELSGQDLHDKALIVLTMLHAVHGPTAGRFHNWPVKAWCKRDCWSSVRAVSLRW